MTLFKDTKIEKEHSPAYQSAVDYGIDIYQLEFLLTLTPAERLMRHDAALADVHPRFRMAQDLLPLPQTPEELRNFKNLYLLTDLGQLDVSSEIAGIGKYTEVRQHAIQVDVAGMPVWVLDLDTLILAKKAMNSPKDRQMAIELSAIRERLNSVNKK